MWNKKLFEVLSIIVVEIIGGAAYSSVSAAETLTLPIEFHILRSSHIKFDRSILQKILEKENETWAPCDIQFTLSKPIEHFDLISNLRPSKSQIKSEKNKLNLQLKTELSPAEIKDSFIEILANHIALSKNLSSKVLNKTLEDAGSSSLPIIVLDNPGRLGPYAPAQTLGTLSRDGLVDLFLNKTENPEILTTSFILYGINDEDPAQLELGKKHYSQIIHETGHFLGLNHDRFAPPNLMFFNSGEVLARQCEIARSFLKKKLGLDTLASDGKSCRESVLSHACQVSKIGTRSCGKDNPYSTQILQIYDQYPDFLKRELCNVSSIEILETPSFQGFAGTAKLGDGFKIMIRQSVVEHFMSMAEFFTIKEQISFANPADAPVVLARSAQGSNSALLPILTHELGHVISFEKSLNDGWTQFSWEGGSPSDTPLAENDFPNRTSMCFYSCWDKISDSSIAGKFYTDLMGTSFSTSYGATDSYEDLAESFWLFVLNRFNGGSQVIKLKSGEEFDLAEHFLTPQMKVKREFFENILNESNAL
jgi:hypothetical protein